jgi:hypothetical protein
MSFNLYVDDVRPAPTGWQLATNVAQAKKFLATAHVNWLSLDHDLGSDTETGMDIVKYIVDSGNYPNKVTFHTKNPVGRKNMYLMLLRYGPYKVTAFGIELTRV